MELWAIIILVALNVFALANLLATLFSHLAVRAFMRAIGILDESVEMPVPRVGTPPHDHPDWEKMVEKFIALEDDKFVRSVKEGERGEKWARRAYLVAPWLGGIGR